MCGRQVEQSASGQAVRLRPDHVGMDRRRKQFKSRNLVPRFSVRAKLLQAMGPDAVIQRVYASAPARLTAVMECLRGHTVQLAALGQAESWSAQPQPALPPAPVASGSGAIPPAVAPIEGPGQPTSSIPRKRKKAAPPVNPDDVIEISD